MCFRLASGSVVYTYCWCSYTASSSCQSHELQQLPVASLVDQPTGMGTALAGHYDPTVRGVLYNCDTAHWMRPCMHVLATELCCSSPVQARTMHGMCRLFVKRLGAALTQAADVHTL